MKKLILSIAAVALLCSFAAPVKYDIKGNVTGLTGKVYLMDGQNPIDSAEVKDGKFHLAGEVAEPIYTVLRDDNGMVAMIMLEEGSIDITGDAETANVSVTGTVSNDNNAKLIAKTTELRAKLKQGELTDELKNEIFEEYDRDIRRHIDANRDNLFGVYLFVDQRTRELSPDEIYAEIAKFDSAWHDHRYMKIARERAEMGRKTAVGATYMDITLPDAEGNELSLSDYVGEGKYVLLDFWASWCGPCMGEIPHLVEAYRQYHDKGFEIFGVSLDNKKDAWVKCIEDKEMNWIHVSSLSGWKCPGRIEYGVEGIPASFLIGPDGKIVARSLRGEELRAKLAELLD